MFQLPENKGRMMRRKDQGQTLVEYSLILALIAIVGLLGVAAMQGSVDTLYDIVNRAGDAMRDAL